MSLFTALMGFSLLFGTTPSPALHARVIEPVVQAAPSYSVTITAYNAVPAQTDSNPFETASGAYSNPEVVAARSGNLAKGLPFGTIIELDGSDITQTGTCGFGVVAPLIGYRVIADTMNAKFTDRVDILFDTKSNYTTASGNALNAAHILGICEGVTVRVVGHVDIRNIPKTQQALARLVIGDTVSKLALK